VSPAEIGCVRVLFNLLGFPIILLRCALPCGGSWPIGPFETRR
jgi:hypothetical protein